MFCDNADVFGQISCLFISFSSGLVTVASCWGIYYVQCNGFKFAEVTLWAAAEHQTTDLEHPPTRSNASTDQSHKYKLS